MDRLTLLEEALAMTDNFDQETRLALVELLETADLPFADPDDAYAFTNRDDYSTYRGN
jgi:hypothetical protein